jgi:CBS domain-containing protein
MNRMRTMTGDHRLVVPGTETGRVGEAAVTIRPSATVTEAAQLMQALRIKRLPVVDEEGRLAGIVSRADVLSVFGRPDEEIRDAVVKAVIAPEPGLDPDRFGITVRSGIVTLTGEPCSRAATSGHASSCTCTP